MEEQILKILLKNITVDIPKNIPYFPTALNGVHESKKEITSHVMEFIEWFMWQDEIACEGCAKNNKNELIFFDDDATERTLEEVYLYWLNNIKNK
jgi:hypothetical protein